MNKKTETVLKDLEGQAAEFFDQLADWAYAQSEACLIEPDIEMQDYEKDGDNN